MAALTIKNLPDDLYEELKHLAEVHRRSINSEVIVCLEKALRPRKINIEEQVKRVQALRERVQQNQLSPLDIENAINEGRP